MSQYVALLIDFLENNASLDPDRTTIIGYSLGGHIASLSAHFGNGKIREVIGKSNDEAFDSLCNYLNPKLKQISHLQL